METLRKILKGVSVEDFFTTNWGKEYIHIKGDECDYDAVLNWDRFNTILMNRDLSPHLRFFYKGNTILPQTLSNGERTRNSTPKINMEDALKFSEGGATTIIQHIHTMDSILGDMAKYLADDFLEDVNINAYYSSAEIRGFDFHTDSHEAIIIQIEGKKEWTVLNAESTLPLKSQLIKANKHIDTSNKKTFLVEKGDFLYIPRGTWHKAIAIEPSLHLTISIRCKYNYDFVHDFTQQLLAKRFFRENLRSSFPDSAKITREKLIEVLDKMKEDIDIYKKSPELESYVNKVNKTQEKLSAFNFPYYQ